MADRARIADLWGGYGAGNDLRDFDLVLLQADPALGG